MTVSAAELLGGDDIARRALHWFNPSVRAGLMPTEGRRADGALVWFEHVTLGTVAVSPDATEARDAVERARRTAALMAAWTGPGATYDGHPVSILANVQDGAAARAARETPAEGVGLFPIELCFLNRETEPASRSRRRSMAKCWRRFPARRWSSDAESDKPLKFVRHPDEANRTGGCGECGSPRAIPA